MNKPGLAGVVVTAMICGCAADRAADVSPGSVGGAGGAGAPPGWICTATYCQVPDGERAAEPQASTIRWTITRFRCPNHAILVETGAATVGAAPCPPCPACPAGGAPDAK